VRQLDFAGGELKLVDAELARFALSDTNTLRLMTIPGVDMAVAVAIVAPSETSPASSPRTNWGPTSA